MRGYASSKVWIPNKAGAEQRKKPEAVNQDYTLPCPNDRMEPTIPKGSTVIVKLQQGVKDGEIALVYNAGEYLLKRLYTLRDCLMLTDEKPGGTMYLYGNEKDTYIMGKVQGYMMPVA